MLEFLLSEPSSESDDWPNLYDVYAHIIINYVISKGCHRELAQDVLQETMLTLWKKLEEHHSDPDVEKDKLKTKTMVLTIAHSRLVDILRKNSRYVALDLQLQNRLSTKDKVNWDQEIEEHIKNKVISKLKKELDELKYTVFKMVILDAKKVHDVAEILGLQPRQISDIKYELAQRIAKECKKIRRQYEP